jgi:hypothetical protein
MEGRKKKERKKERKGVRKKGREESTDSATNVNFRAMNLPPLVLRQTGALRFVFLLLLLAQGQVVQRHVIASVQLHRKTCM